MAYYARYEPDETGALQKVVYNCGVGFCLPFYGETAPPGTLACDGSEISREAYKELFTVLGTKAGAGNGSTTFNLPDLRGQFVRGTGGNAAVLGTVQGDAIRNITGNVGFRSGQDGATQIVYGFSDAFELSDYAPSATSYTVNNTYSPTCTVHFDASNVVPTAAENRPTNVALLWCIIYE